MARTPEETALAAVAKAITDETKAREKRESLQEKYDAAVSAEKRATRTTEWTSRHPDLPDDFDLEAFRAEQAAPFDEEDSAEEGEVATEGEALADETDFQNGPGGDGAVPPDLPDVEDPFADDFLLDGETETAPTPAPARSGRRKS